jgi:pyruvate kinase
MADLQGPKMRVGLLAEEPIELKRGDALRNPQTNPRLEIIDLGRG